MVNIHSIAVQQTPEHVRVSAHIEMPDHAGEAWFELPSGVATDQEAAADAFYVLGLVLAMGSDGSLTMSEPVSQRLVYNTRAIQDILVGWYPKRLGHAQPEVSVRAEDKPLIQNRTVSCFTGGVDSFDSLINNFDSVDALLYVHGYDIGLHRTEIRAATSAHLREVAAETGKELIEVATNIREFLNRAAVWSIITHGPALAAVGHMLSGDYGRLMVPASHTYADKYAWGSHPLVDHLWSNNRLSVVHDGAGSTRVEKTRNLSDNVSAQNHLRVCWQNTGKFNCGECDKCLRTMVALSLTGVLEEFKTFEPVVPLDSVRKLSISGLSGRSFVVENLVYARECGATEIAEVLEKMVNDFDAQRSKKSAEAREIAALKKQVAKLDKRLTNAGKRLATTERQIVKTQGVLDAEAKRGRALEIKVQKLHKLLPIRLWMKLRRR